MSTFTNDDPKGKYLPDGYRFQLDEPLTYAVGDEASPEKITVPAGFITDFASVPRVIQIFLPQSIGRRAAILHDYLYHTHGEGGRYTRREADGIFLEALKVLDVPWYQRFPLFWGVRIGGWVPWSKK